MTRMQRILACRLLSSVVEAGTRALHKEELLSTAGDSEHKLWHGGTYVQQRTCSTLSNSLHRNLFCVNWFFFSFLAFCEMMLLELTAMGNFEEWLWMWHVVQGCISTSFLCYGGHVPTMQRQAASLKTNSFWRSLWSFLTLWLLSYFSSFVTDLFSTLNPCHWWNNYGTYRNGWNNSIFTTDSKSSAE